MSGGVGAPRERAEDQAADDQVGGLAVEAVAPRDYVRQRLQHHLEFVGAAAAEAREMGRLAPLLACGNKTGRRWTSIQQPAGRSQVIK